MKEVIDELGGAVFPKFPWSAPTDARWISTTGNLRCTRPEDVLLLLKASDRLSHDMNLSKSLSSSSSWRPSLILRKWHDLNPSMEFRCFLRPGAYPIVGVSQRDPAYYDYLEGLRGTLETHITAFLRDEIIPVLMGQDDGAEGSLGHVVDVYYEQSSGKVWLIDVNPWDPSSTLPLLFTWPEILEASEPLGFRFVRSQADASAFYGVDPLNAYPQEAVAMSMNSTPADLARWANISDLSNIANIGQ